MLVLLIAGLTIPVACGDDAPPFAFPAVSSPDLGVEPTVVSSTTPPRTTMVRVLHDGSGRAIEPHDVVVANTKAQVWTTKAGAPPPLLNTFSDRHLLFRSIDQMVPGWSTALPGVKVGSRVVLVTPPQDAFGPDGNVAIGVGRNQSLVWVIDVLAAMPVDAMADGTPAKHPADPALPTVSPGKNPTITVPRTAAPTSLVRRALLTGTGARIAGGQVVLAQYTGVIWRNGNVFDTSWRPERGPFNARVAESSRTSTEPGVIQGWVRGLVGQRVGSRILLVVPPNLGYGRAGNPSAGITGRDTLVFVIDILGVYPDPTQHDPTTDGAAAGHP
jgi:peptidylprolyl isomerase